MNLNNQNFLSATTCPFALLLSLCVDFQPSHAQQQPTTPIQQQQAYQQQLTPEQQQAYQQRIRAQQQQAQQQAPFAAQSPEIQQYIDNVLGYWKQESDKIERYECKFRRWTYDSTKMPNNLLNNHSSVSQGLLRHAPPDKGIFKVEKYFQFVGVDSRQTNQSNVEAYKEIEGQFGDWWQCDGESVYEFKRNQKTVHVYPIPEQARGDAIMDSPLPFFFGIEPTKVRERYWVRLIESPNDTTTGKPLESIIALEIYPRRMEDAENYKMVQVFLDKSDFLPASIVQFNPQHTDDTPNKMHYEFFERKINPSTGFGFLRRDFIPKIPSDFKVINEVDEATLRQMQNQNSQQPGRVASQPGQSLPK